MMGSPWSPPQIRRGTYGAFSWRYTNHTRSSYYATTPRSAALLSGPLVLAAKYEANALKDRIVAHINADWPSENFLEWKQRSESLAEGGRPGSRAARAPGAHDGPLGGSRLRAGRRVLHDAVVLRSPSSLQTELLHAKDKLMEPRVVHRHVALGVDFGGAVQQFG
ncbi:hypothetical protein BDN71DRAFT_550518 [Pleurotus eryngii]|uniref:Uncharacterized protein n=1 Tax=Pleurotus eryngii TaxID=5323 RepID=A0A9P6D8T4_PLEER|nr:hypothetical protein BDN71DRAFT_550518 [Pleurotus eryngii]